MSHAGHPDRREFTGTVQPCQCWSIAPIRLDVISTAHWTERRRNHHALMAKFSDLSVQVIAAKPSLSYRDGDHLFVHAHGDKEPNSLLHGSSPLSVARRRPNKCNPSA